MLKIVRSAEPGCVVFTLSGRVEVQHAVDLEAAFEKERVPIIVDLDDVRLVARETVPSLARWKRSGVTLRNCPGYIRAWIEQERGEA